MRRAILVILAFLPAVAAYVLLHRADKNEKPRLPGVEQAEGENPGLGASLTGYSGKGTFYRRLSPLLIGDQEIAYPSTYYLLDEWSRDGNAEFNITGLMVLRNEKPRSLDELDSKLLQISNEGSSAERRKAMTEARAHFDSLVAARGRASGGKTVADSDNFSLEGGVEAQIPARDGSDERLRVESESASLTLPDGRLATIDLPESFRAEHPRYRLEGRGLHADDRSADVVIESDPFIENLGLTEGSRRQVTAKGKLVWRPDSASNGSIPDILDRLRLDFGEVEISDQVRITVDDHEFTGDHAKLRIGKKDGTLRGKITGFVLSGDIAMKSPRGLIRGDRARGVLEEDEGMSIVVDGRRSSVLWTSDPERTEPTFSGSCTGPIQVSLPPRRLRKTTPLVLTLDRDVVLDFRNPSEQVHLEGENLKMDVGLVSLLREGEENDEVWRLTQATLIGRAKGTTTEYDFTTPRLDLVRSYDQNGVHTKDDLGMEGPVHINRKGGLGRTDPALTTEIDALRRVELVVSAFERGNTEARAFGNVRVRELRGRKIERSLDCDSLELISGLEEDLTGEGRPVVKSLDARDSVSAIDEKGSTLRGDLVTWDRASREGHLSGSPARAGFVDSLGRRQEIAAETLDFSSIGRRVTGKGDVNAKLFFPALLLNDNRPKTDDERVEERPSIPWTLQCASLTALFTGTMPLAPIGEDEAEAPIELAEVDLEGLVRVENDDQRIIADSLHYDLLGKTGSATGTPVKVRAYRVLETSERVEDWLEAESMTIDPDWTLLQGGGRALLHVAAEKQEVGRPRRFENLSIVCAEDVLLKGNDLQFTGRTRLVRGVAAEGGLDIVANGITARFASRPDDKPGRGELQRVVALGAVAISWRDLAGEGEALTVDYVEQKVTLEARPGESCWLKQGRGFTARSEAVIYDMVTRKITQTRLRVEKRGEVR